MGTKIHDLERLLDECKVERLQTVNDMILARLPPPVGLPFVVTVSGEGSLIQLRTVELFTVGAHRRADARRVAAEMNSRYKLVKVAVHATSGEVIVTIDVVVADEPLSRRQLERCVNVLGPVAVGGRERLRVLDATGSDPGEQATDRHLMLAMLPGLATPSQPAKPKPPTTAAALPAGPLRSRTANVEDLLGQLLESHNDSDKPPR